VPAQRVEFPQLCRCADFFREEAMGWENDEEERRRIYDRAAKLWAHAFNGANPGESANALAALRRLQSEQGLSDVALAFIVEQGQQEPAPSRLGISEHPPNVLELILHLFEDAHIILPLEQAVTAALWILHAAVFRQFQHTPRLVLRSPEPACGKTTLLACMQLLIRDALKTGSTSPAVIYYRLRAFPDSTLLLDEMEHSTLWANDKLLLNIIDEGHRVGGKVTRVLKGEVVEFSVFAPLALALVAGKRLPPQLLSRTIVLDLKRHPEGRDELTPDDPSLSVIRRAIAQWATDFLRSQNVRVPLLGRATDNWHPLVEIADSLGYGATTRATALLLNRHNVELEIVLLADIRRIFEQRSIDRIWTDELLLALHQLEDAPWDEFWGLDDSEEPHKLRRGELYRLLRKKDIRSRSVQRARGEHRESRKGFLREQFEPVWAELFGTSAHPSKIIRLTRHKSGTSER
jgi:hypothetical protein